MRRTTRGMALVLVLMISSVMLFCVTFLWRANQDDLPRIQLNVLRMQTYFLARGAMQVAALKMRLFPTAAYDAAAYAEGRNPYCDHSPTGYDAFEAGTDRNVWRGPLFFTGTATYNAATHDYTRTLTKDSDGDGSDDTICERYLQKFGQDLVSGGASAIKLDRGSVDPVTGLADPFSGSFSVTGLSVLGFKSGRRYNEEAIELKVTATITNARVVGAVTDITRDFSLDETAVFKVTRH